VAAASVAASGRQCDASSERRKLSVWQHQRRISGGGENSVAAEWHLCGFRALLLFSPNHSLHLSHMLPLHLQLSFCLYFCLFSSNALSCLFPSKRGCWNPLTCHTIPLYLLLHAGISPPHHSLPVHLRDILPRGLEDVGWANDFCYCTLFLSCTTAHCILLHLLCLYIRFFFFFFFFVSAPHCTFLTLSTTVHSVFSSGAGICGQAGQEAWANGWRI